MIFVRRFLRVLAAPPPPRRGEERRGEERRAKQTKSRIQVPNSRWASAAEPTSGGEQSEQVRSMVALLRNNATTTQTNDTNFHPVTASILPPQPLLAERRPRPQEVAGHAVCQQSGYALAAPVA